MSKRAAKDDSATQSQSSKRSCTGTGQSTLFRYYEKASGPSSAVKTMVDVTPVSMGVKMYTKEDIEASSGMKKLYFQFWNDKACELCKDESVREKMKGNKRAFMGAINCSWTIHRTKIIQLQAEEVIELAGKVYPDEVAREQKLTSIRNNVSRVKEALDSTNSFYEITKDSDPSEIEGMEDELTTKVRELKVAQEALLKAIHRKREDMLGDHNDAEADFMTAESPVKLSSDDVEVLVDAIKEDASTCTDHDV